MKTKKLGRSNLWQYYAMLIPGVVVTFIFCYIPLYGVIIAFEDYNVGLGFSSPWVGLQNFRYVFNQPTFTRTIWNTLYMSVWKLALRIVVPVTVAILLNELRSDKLKRFYQTLIYIPNFLSWIIMAGVLMDILSSGGAINLILHALGLPTVDFLGNAKIFPWTMIISDVWKGFGYGTIVYLAALTGIDPTLYESAMLDGASRWQQIKNVTIPLLMPTIVLMTVLSLGSILNAGFDQVFNLYSPLTYSTGDIIDTYVYRQTLVNGQYGFGTAVGLFKSLVGCALMLGSNYASKKIRGRGII
jgi:putative aldouronate transport system permease protein